MITTGWAWGQRSTCLWQVPGFWDPLCLCAVSRISFALFSGDVTLGGFLGSAWDVPERFLSPFYSLQWAP